MNTDTDRSVMGQHIYQSTSTVVSRITHRIQSFTASSTLKWFTEVSPVIAVVIFMAFVCFFVMHFKNKLLLSRLYLSLISPLQLCAEGIFLNASENITCGHLHRKGFNHRLYKRSQKFTASSLTCHEY